MNITKGLIIADPWIRRFFEDNAAAAGDRVTVTPYRYRVRLSKSVGIQK